MSRRSSRRPSRGPLRRGARRSSSGSSASSSPPRRELLARRRRAAARARRRRAARLPPRDAGRPRGRLARRARRRPTCATAACEITGPVERKMMINALNSGARVFMADFEDANSPTWENVRRAASGTSPTRSERDDRARDAARRATALNDEIADAPRPPARLAPAGAARPGRRRARLGEPLRLRAHRVPQRAEPARARLGAVLLPAEAREPPRGAALERRLRASPRTGSGCRRGTIRATVLIETILAAFEMEEILYELREHSAARSTPGAGTTSSA